MLLFGCNSYRQPRTEMPRPIEKNTIVQPLGVQTSLEVFFSQHPKFQYQPTNSPVLEFNRLFQMYRREFQNAMTGEFNDLYGSDEHDINNWYKLCNVLRINPVPDTLQRCRAAVLRKHVNLVDLVHGSKVEVRLFKTEKQLSEYTKETEKYFPKESARDGGVLRALRRRILAPRDDRISHKRDKSHKGSKK